MASRYFAFITGSSRDGGYWGIISFSLRVASSRPASERSDELACGFTPSSFEIHLVVQSRFRTTKVPSRRTSLLGSHSGPDVSVSGLLEESFACCSAPQHWLMLRSIAVATMFQIIFILNLLLWAVS